jgi:hypothetical protein
MTFKARVFLDTAVAKHSIRARTVLKPTRHQVNILGRLQEVVVQEIVKIDPAASVEPRLRAQIDLLPEVVRRARVGDIELVWNIETQLEFFEIYLYPGGGTSELLDAVKVIEGPIKYDRAITPMSPLSGETSRSLRTDFLRGLDCPRFLELQRACGAFQGDHGVNENQLVDAFHIWCAEAADASHFLTTDFRLVRAVRGHKTAPRASGSWPRPNSSTS